ncbi:hypothetical protein CVT26_011824 [Gymnopilus dilepis]|uniref:Uncharacterized protein n=1 Tax=Gymnopilus dilepis TaxID=231916 RepID=A0A409W9A4_9AGAR|nr:hypothetical protein CVT26_011824 [Gymnopilus dilepis]
MKAGTRWFARHPHINLMVFNLVACFFLVLAMLGTPYIKGIDLFELDVSESTDTLVITFGVWGYCSKVAQDFDSWCYAFGSGDEAGALTSISRALVLHTFTVILVAATIPVIVLCHCKKILLNGLCAWGSRFNGLLALTAVSCFAIDIAFFSEAKQYYATNHALLGSAVWYTLGGSAILLLGGWLFEIQSSQSNQFRASALSRGPLQHDLDHPQDLPSHDIESGIHQFEGEQPHDDVEELPIALHNALNRSVRHEEGDHVTSLFTSSGPYIDSSASPASDPRDKQPRHTLEGQAGGLEGPSTSSGGSPFEWALVGKTTSAESLHKRASTVSGYAPMSYHTYNESESSPTSVQPSQISPSPIDEESPTLQPASVTVHTSRSSKHSVVDPYNRPASWLSRNYTKLKKPRPRSSRLASDSTLSSLLHEFPSTPTTPVPSSRNPSPMPYHPYSIFTVGRPLGAPASDSRPRSPAPPKYDEADPLQDIPIARIRKSSMKPKTPPPSA